MTLKDNNPGINPWLIINTKFNPELNHSTSVFKERRNYTYWGEETQKKYREDKLNWDSESRGD